MNEVENPYSLIICISFKKYNNDANCCDNDNYFTELDFKILISIMLMLINIMSCS